MIKLWVQCAEFHFTPRQLEFLLDRIHDADNIDLPCFIQSRQIHDDLSVVEDRESDAP